MDSQRDHEEATEEGRLESELVRLAHAGQLSDDSSFTDVELDQVVKSIFEEHSVLCLPRIHLLLHLALDLKVKMGMAEELAKKLWSRYILLNIIDKKTMKPSHFEWVPDRKRDQWVNVDIQRYLFPYCKRKPSPITLELNIGAVAAEIAAANHYKAIPNLSVDPCEDYFDFIWNGRRVEVRWNSLMKGDLLVTHLKIDRLYVLVCGLIPKKRSSFKLYIGGQMVGSKIPELGDLVELKNGQCWRVPRKLLEPPPIVRSFGT